MSKMDESGEFSDDLDEFEASMDDRHKKNLKNQTTFKDKPYDEAFEVSQDLSVAESFDGRDKQRPKERQLKNDKYDEAVEVSQSLDQTAMSTAAAKPKIGNFATAKPSAPAEVESKGLSKNNEMSKSQSVLNKPFDEALEFSRSGSDDSVDTQGRSRTNGTHHHHQAAPSGPSQALKSAPIPQTAQDSQEPKRAAPAQSAQPQNRAASNDGESSDDEDGDVEESYDNIEGAYNAKDYQHLNVSVEVRDLFQYIERYKPHEVQLDAPLKCFIPEYIPAIGELDPFIKVPRPDGREDGLGLRFLDEPSTAQSDPTVLELQLRAKSKKLQYGDVAVRSIENADKNPAKIEKWIQDIKELHRSKPPPQVNYKKNMPDIDSLMEVWPEDFEQLLRSSPLPSPDLDLSLAEYVRVLCSILDIPVYDNPIESLHLLFSLYIDFRNNPHFQSRMISQHADPKAGGGAGVPANYDNNYGAADVLEIG